MIVILDFGSQYTYLIVKSVQQLNVSCKVIPFDVAISEILELKPEAIILSGSPYSVMDAEAPFCDKSIFELGIPILGICYGMQLICHLLDGRVGHSLKKEFGYVELIVDEKYELFEGLETGDVVWMSHSDNIEKVPVGFETFSSTVNTPFVAMQNKSEKIYAVQFHPEVSHTEKGLFIFKNFIYNICGLKPNWTPGSFIEKASKKIREKVGDAGVVLGLSGGVDSSVTAALLHEVIGDKLIPILVDTGLMRKNEVIEIQQMFKNSGIHIEVVDAKDVFLEKLKGVTGPEEKRKIIGRLFIEIFEKEALEFDNVQFLAQGTLYPDVIESSSSKTKDGPSVTIKSHHNVGGLPEKLNLKLIEPLRELFKYEVRVIGKELGLPDEILFRHPFPGPGLAVRIIGDITEEKVSILQEIDFIFIDELRKNYYYDRIWQAFAVLLPVQTVGVMGDDRTYENVCALRAVNSLDGMTADWTKIPYKILRKISNRIINEVNGVNRVVYDISSKPPSTIEWE
ncbi:MAG: glutamine-hydrolyzing GMP synthase [Candidatus Cloacimonas sp. 4484_140]|nr:MAG: glutamine-hydrolyzing GMP synthase [Candidatus Cloacimonas sp. 4484_140]